MARRMMKAQMDHALTRLGEAFDEILGDRPKGQQHARLKAEADLLRSGKVKISNLLVKRAIRRFDHDLARDARYCDSISRWLRVELDEALELAYKPKPDPKVVAWDARHKKLSAKYQEAKDEIILGDVDRALLLIAKFRKIKV